MIRIRLDGEEQQVSYEEFIRAIQEGRVRAETSVWSEVLTSGTWKPAGDLRFFRAWAPPGRSGPEEPPASPSSAEPIPGAGGGPPPSPQAVEPGSTPGPGFPPYQEVEPPPWPAVEGESRPGVEIPPARPEPRDRFEGVADREEPLPWEQMEKIGFGSGLYGTIWLAFRNVREFYRRIDQGSAFLPALAFGLLLTAFSALILSVYDLATAPLLSGVNKWIESSFPELFQEGAEPSLRMNLYWRGVILLLYPALAFVGAGLTHLLLRAFGRPRRGFTTTFRVATYSSAVNVLVVVPVCGSFIAGVWGFVLMVRGLSRLHDVSPLLVVAVILFPAVVAGCLAGLLMIVGARAG